MKKKKRKKRHKKKYVNKILTPQKREIKETYGVCKINNINAVIINIVLCAFSS